MHERPPLHEESSGREPNYLRGLAQLVVLVSVIIITVFLLTA